jgi:hypothetical protein
MNGLPFETVRRIFRALECTNIENLVAVFSQAEGDDCLLVYNTDAPPAPPCPSWRVALLSEVKPADYASFDGPLLGLSAIDLILPDVPTHGANFYSIVRLFTQCQQRQALQRTSFHLAQTILAHLLRLPTAERARAQQRGYTKILQLSLPSLLTGCPLDRLVAVLPAADLGRYLDPAKPGLQLVYIDTPSEQLARAEQDPQSQWVIGIEEYFLFEPVLNRDPNHFVSLRQALRQLGEMKVLKATCRELARMCWQVAVTRDDPKYRTAAYSLAAETWLMDEDVEDLVAVIPHHDFERFTSQGDALRVYRIPRQAGAAPTQPAGRSCSLEDLLLSQPLGGAYESSPALTITALCHFLERSTKQACLDLGPILWKANKSANLARVFWLLSRDLLDPPHKEWLQLNPSSDAVTDLATRATLIYSLSDPWFWRQGRYELFLTGCYEHLDRCLLRQEQRGGAMGYYYKAIRAWYACYNADDYLRNLEQMVHDCRAFQEAYALEAERTGIPARYYSITRHLVSAAETILRPDTTHSAIASDEQEPTAFQIVAYLRGLTDRETQMREPSQVFDQLLTQYLDDHNRWRDFQRRALSHRPGRDELDQLLDHFVRQRRELHAPAHEWLILDRAYDADIDRIQHLKQAMGASVSIDITARNQVFAIGAQAVIVLDVQNTGSQAATRFRLEIASSSGFELLSPHVMLEAPVLESGERRRVECQARATDTALVLNINCYYRDSDGRSIMARKRVLLEARRPSAGGFRSRMNPYEVGRPVFGPGSFFGRRQELQEILSRLARGSTQPLVLRGPRRIGKSSMLWELALLLEDPVERRARALPPELESQISHIHPVKVSLQAIDRNLPNYFESFMGGVILREMCVSLGLDNAYTVELLDSFSRRCWLDGLPAAFLQHTGEMYVQRPHERLVVLIDELDEMLFREENRGYATQLRNIIETEQRVSWITASTVLSSSSVGRYGSPWFNLLQPIDIKGIDWESGIELITSLSRGAGFDWEIEAVVAVLDQTGQRPYLMQLICAKIIDYLNRHNHEKASVGAVSTVTNQMLEDSDSTSHYLGFIWNEASWMGRIILWILDRNHPAAMDVKAIGAAIESMCRQWAIRPTSARFHARFVEQIEWLQKIADVIALRERRYSFSVPFAHRWLKQFMTQTPDFLDRAAIGLADELGAN